MSPLDFIDYLLRLIKETENEASNHRVELLKSSIEEYVKNNTVEECTPICRLRLSTRARRCLENRDIKTVEELTRKSERQLIIGRQLGPKTMQEIKDALASMGLTLREE